MDKMREEFEVWAVDADLDTSCYIDNGEQGDYCDVVAQYAWLGWKASRAALCVELPSFENGSIRGYSGDCEEASMVVDAIAESLHCAGVPFK